MSRLIAYILGFLSIAASHAQPFTITNYDIPDGMPSSEVYDVIEDRNGFLWFGTDNGVVRFDGQEVRIFQVKDGLTDPVVFNIIEDDDGRLWFRTYSGKLCFMEDGVIKPYPYNNLLANVVGNGLIHFEYTSKTGELWFTARNREGRIDSLGSLSVDTLDSDSQRKSLQVRIRNGKALVITATRWVSHIEQILINDKAFAIKIDSPSYISQVVADIYWRGKLYFSAYNDLFEYQNGQLRRVLRSKNPIISLSADRDGNFWVGYLKGGIERYSDTTFSKPWRLDFLKDKSVSKIHQDKTGGVWFSTIENGVYHVPNFSILHFKMPDHAKIKSVNASLNHIIVGDKNGVVHFFDKQTFRVLHRKAFGYNVMAVFSDSRQNFWISGHAAISVFDPEFRLKAAFDNMNAGDFFETGDRAVWALGRLHLYQFDRDLKKAYEETFYTHMFRNLVVGDSVVFLGGRIGLHQMNIRTRHIQPVKGFENFKISDMCVLNDTTLLFSTTGNGFIVYRTMSGELNHYHTGNNFIANNIYATLKKDSLLWIGTEKGVAVTPVSTLLANKPRYRFLNNKSGLGSNIVSFLADGGHAVWAFSDDGFSVIPDTITRFASRHPAFYVKSMESNHKRLNLGSEILLDPGGNNLKISFGFISFNNNNVFLRYKINDQDPWQKTEDDMLEFMSLAPGDYSVRLQYSPDNVDWYDCFEPKVITVLPPWYRRWYVAPIAALTVVLLGYIYFRHQRSIYRQKHHYLRIINEHQQKLLQSEVVTLERERNRIAKELHDGVGTTLTAIKLRVGQLLRQYHDATAEEIEDQFQATVSELKNIIYGLTPPSLERYGLFTALRNYVNKIQKNLPARLSLKTYGYEINNYELNLMSFRIIQELISNSIKHSFAKNISIHVSCFHDLISIIYEDDGVGFKYDPERNGLGLDSIESRIHSIQGSLKFDSGDFGISYNIEIPLPEKKEAH